MQGGGAPEKRRLSAQKRECAILQGSLPLPRAFPNPSPP